MKIVVVAPDSSLVLESRRRAAEHARAQADWDEVARRTEKVYYLTLANLGPVKEPASEPRSPL